MKTFKYEILELDRSTKQWTLTQSGTKQAEHPSDVLDSFDFGGIVEQPYNTYSDGVIERVWNRSGDIYNVDRVGLIVSPVSVASKFS